MGIIPIDLQSIEQWAGCIAGIVFGLIVQGDAQEYFVHMFETLAKRTKIQYRLNPLQHLDLWSIPAFLFAGWGWSSRRVEEPAYFPPRPIPRFLVPLAGPLANFAMVGILSSFYIFLPFAFLEIAIAINIQMALANLIIPLPPLALGRALCSAFEVLRPQRRALEFSGTLIILALVLVEYTARWEIFRPLILEPSTVILKWVLYR